MSVSLSINWPDGRFEDVAIASQRGARWWAEEGQKLGLDLVPHFHSLLVVERDRLDQLINEVTIFRQAMAARGEDYAQTVETADRLLDAFQLLKQSGGWRASIG
jgi:hypothetical protein